jgi:hypothetical protein
MPPRAYPYAGQDTKFRAHECPFRTEGRPRVIAFVTMAPVSFVTGLLAGIVATALAGFFVFRARAVGGQSSGRYLDLRALISLLALVVAVVAFVRSGDSGSDSASAPSAPATDRSSSSVATDGSASSSTSSSVLVANVTVPTVVGLSQKDATAELQALGLRVLVQTLPLRNVPPGFVVTQTPIAFSTTTRNTVVIIGVSVAA